MLKFSLHYSLKLDTRFCRPTVSSRGGIGVCMDVESDPLVPRQAASLCRVYSPFGGRCGPCSVCSGVGRYPPPVGPWRSEGGPWQALTCGVCHYLLRWSKIGYARSPFQGHGGSERERLYSVVGNT